MARLGDTATLVCYTVLTLHGQFPHTTCDRYCKVISVDIRELNTRFYKVIHIGLSNYLARLHITCKNVNSVYYCYTIMHNYKCVCPIDLFERGTNVNIKITIIAFCRHTFWRCKEKVQYTGNHEKYSRTTCIIWNLCLFVYQLYLLTWANHCANVQTDGRTQSRTEEYRAFSTSTLLWFV